MFTFQDIISDLIEYNSIEDVKPRCVHKTKISSTAYLQLWRYFNKRRPYNYPDRIQWKNGIGRYKNIEFKIKEENNECLLFINEEFYKHFETPRVAKLSADIYIIENIL